MSSTVTPGQRTCEGGPERQSVGGAQGPFPLPSPGPAPRRLHHEATATAKVGAPKMPRKAHLSGANWEDGPLCPTGLGGCMLLTFPLSFAICPKNYPSSVKLQYSAWGEVGWGLNLRLRGTRTFQPKDWGVGSTGEFLSGEGSEDALLCV